MNRAVRAIRTWVRRLLTALMLVGPLLIAGAGAGVTVAQPVVAVAAIEFPGGPSQHFTISGAVQTEATLTLADLQALPTQTVTAETRTRMGSQGTATYRGVLLKDLLDMVAKLQLDPNTKNDALARAITAYGSDGYRATIAYGEIDPDFGGQPILVAFEINGQPLADRDGMCELIVPGDKLAGRWVKNLVALTVAAPGV